MDDCCFPLQRKSPSRVHCEEGTPPTKLTHTTAPRRSTVSRAGSWRVFRYDGFFYSMIFGGEMSKIGHGVGRFMVAIFGGCAMWRFFLRLLASKKSLRAKNPTPLVSTSFLTFRYAFVIPFCLFLTMCISVTIKY
jgi:hypothetical protein